MRTEPIHSWWREPLLHFVVLGLAVFAIHHFFAPAPESDHVIRIDAQRQRALAGDFAKRRGRPPTDEELQSVVEDWITGEMLYREGVALGLDRDDETVRNHLIQKMLFVVSNRDVVKEPTDEDLQKWLEQHPQRFYRPASSDFVHILVNGDQPNPQAHAEALRQTLAQGGELHNVNSGHVRQYHQRTREHVQEIFGTAFAALLEHQPPGIWALQQSDQGWHVVRVDARRGSGVPDLAEIRDEVTRHWRTHQQRQLALLAMEALRQSYRIQKEGL